MDQLKEGLLKVFDSLSILYLLACETGLIVTYSSNTMIFQAVLIYILIASRVGLLWIKRRRSEKFYKRALVCALVYSLALAIMVTVFQCGRSL